MKTENLNQSPLELTTEAERCLFEEGQQHYLNYKERRTKRVRPRENNWGG